MAKIAVVEDNAAVRQELCGFIAQYAQESGQLLEVTPFADGSQIVEPYRPGFDIIFLDIEMPTLGGMPTAERIRLLDPDVVLIFVTNMAQYAIRGYEVDALDFVLKPVSYYQFSTKLDRALQRICRRRGGQITLQVGGGVQLLATDDILYLETRDRLLHYHTTTGTWSVCRFDFPVKTKNNDSFFLLVQLLRRKFMKEEDSRACPLNDFTKIIALA